MANRGRTLFLRVAVVTVMFGLVGRLAWVQVVKAGQITEWGEDMRLIKRTIEPIRGAITDRSGRYLAVSVPYFKVIADPFHMDDKDEAVSAAKLAPLLQMDASALVKLLQESPKSQWVPLKDGLDSEQKRAVEALGIPGISMEQQLRRTYPQGFTANHVVGFVNADHRGDYGLEARYDQELNGNPGYIVAEFTDGNTPIEGTVKQSVASEPGKTLVLTIDVALQQAVEKRLEDVVKETKAKRALALAMDAHTGEILLMAMRPGADPGNRSTWLDPTNPGQLDFNRVNNWATSPLPPGSIFKTITTSIALEEKRISLGSTFIDTGQLRRSGRVIYNWDGVVAPNPAPMTIAQLLQRSSNVGLIQVGETIPHDTFVRYLNAFGFMDKTGVDLSYEDHAVGLEKFDKKTDIDWANMYIGQHLEVTPIQMITAVSTIANGGNLVQPHLVREIRDSGGQVVWTAPTGPRRQVISAATATEVQQLMISVIEKGTGSGAQTPGYTVGGKTGTAQKFENGAMKERNLADFIGFAPASNPKVVMLVMVDEPEGEGFGGMIAAPLFRDLLPQVMRTVGIAPDTKAARGEEVAPPKVVTGVVPNVQWLPVERAKERIVEAGFAAKLSGAGTIVSAQSLRAGSTERTGGVVELTLADKPQAGGNITVPDFTGLSLTEAGQLAAELGLTLKASGSGFVADQDPPVGTALTPRSILSVRLAPRP